MMIILKRHSPNLWWYLSVNVDLLSCKQFQYKCWTRVEHLLDLHPRESLQWRHHWCDGVSNNQPYHCLLNRLFGRRSEKTSNFRVTGLCVGNSPVTGEFPTQMGSNAENVSIWWRHHDIFHVSRINSTKSLHAHMSNLVNIIFVLISIWTIQSHNRDLIVASFSCWRDTFW